MRESQEIDGADDRLRSASDAAAASARQRLLQRFREEGWWATSRRIGRWLKFRIIYTERLLTLEHTFGVARDPSGSLRIEEVQTHHLPGLRALNASRDELANDARFERDLAAGYGGYVALLEDQLIGCFWWVDREMRPIHHELTPRGAHLKLEAGDVYAFDLVIAEAHRGRRYGKEFLDEIERRLAASGYERLIGWVDADNHHARRLYQLRGWHELECLQRTWVLGRSHTRRVSTPVPPLPSDAR